MNTALLVYGVSAIGLVAAVTDLRSKLIPNWITLPAAVVGIAAHVYASPFAWLTALGYSIAGMLLCGLIPYILWRKRGMGGGDVKLLAAIGAWLGPMWGMQVQLYTFAAAVMLLPVILAYRGQLWSTLKRAGRRANFLVRSKQPTDSSERQITELKLGPMIFLGIAFVCWPMLAQQVLTGKPVSPF